MVLPYDFLFSCSNAGVVRKLGLLVLLVPVPVVLVEGEAHPHTGTVSPFQAGDPGVTLSTDALRILKSGQPYRTQLQSGSTGGRGMVVQDVMAPTNVVWGRILDFAAYPSMVPKTIESQIYKREPLHPHRRGSGSSAERICVRMKIGFPLLKLQFFVDHIYDPSHHSLTWTLDYSVKSDLDDSVGLWYVVPHPVHPHHWSRVYYSVEVSLFPWVPHFVVDFMSQQALIDATAWVKKYSELEAAKLGVGVVGAAGPASAPHRRHWWWWWGQERRQHRRALPPTSASTDNSLLATAGNNVAPGDNITNNNHPARLTATRYALVSTVLALSLYNVHLYFSQ